MGSEMPGTFVSRKEAGSASVLDCYPEFLKRVTDLGVVRVARRFHRHHDHIVAIQHRLLFTKAFTDLALDAIAIVGPGRHLLRHGNTKACVTEAVRACVDMK